jgi:hypothetical protein
LLLANGHSEAMHYPLGMLWFEAEIVVTRLNAKEATRAILLQQAVSSILSKDGAKNFRKTIKSMTGG